MRKLYLRWIHQINETVAIALSYKCHDVVHDILLCLCAIPVLPVFELNRRQHPLGNFGWNVIPDDVCICNCRRNHRSTSWHPVNVPVCVGLGSSKGFSRQTWLKLWELWWKAYVFFLSCALQHISSIPSAVSQVGFDLSSRFNMAESKWVDKKCCHVLPYLELYCIRDSIVMMVSK